MIRHLLFHTFRPWRYGPYCHWCDRRARRGLNKTHETVKRLQRQKIEKLTQELEDTKATLEQAMEVVRAAVAWVERVHQEPGHLSHPNQWADDDDFTLIEVVNSWNRKTPHD